MKRTIVLAALLTLSLPASAQVDSGWVQLYQNGAATWNMGYDVAADEAGNCYVVGTSIPGGRSLVKYDRNGNEEWVRTDATSHGFFAAYDRNGVIIEQGVSAGVKAVKYRPDGSERWTGAYYNPAGRAVTPQDMTVDAQGNVYIAGFQGMDSIQSDMLLVKFDSAGNLQWSRTYAGSAGGDDWGAAVCVDAQGDVYLAGSVNNAGTNYDITVVKYASSGSQAWVGTYNSPVGRADNAFDVAADNQGNAYVVGEYWVDVSNYDIVTVQFRPGGAVGWSATAAGSGLSFDRGLRVAVDNFGGVWAAGHVRNTSTADDCWLARYRTDGSVQWSITYDAGRMTSDQTTDLCLDDSGNCYITARAGGGMASEECATLMYDSTGQRIWEERSCISYSATNSPYAMCRISSGDIYLTGTGNVSGVGYFTTFRIPRQKEWGVYVFINGDNNLEEQAIEDFNELEHDANPRQFHTVLQLDRIPGYDSSNGDWTTTRRYLVINDPWDIYGIQSPLQEDLGEQNMGSGQTLADFAVWAAENFPARRICLVCWNHGDGWRDPPPRFGFSDDVTDADRIGVASENHELRRALADIRQRLGRNIDLLCFDACLMAMAEVDEECRDVCDYVVHSEKTVPGRGFDYREILAHLAAEPDATPAQLAADIASINRDSYAPGGRQYDIASVTFSAAELGPVYNRMANALNDFAAELIKAGGRDRTEMVFARDNSQHFDTDPGNGCYNQNADIADFAREVFVAASLPQSLRDAAGALIDSLDQVVYASYFYSDPGDYSVAGAHGLCVYYPTSTLPDTSVYDSLRFAATTLWDEYLRGAIELPDQAIMVYFGNTVGSFVGVDTIRLRITLRNLGRQTATGVRVRLTENDPFVRILQDTSSFPNCPGESTVASLAEFVLSIDPLTPQPHRVPVFAGVTNGRDDSTELSFSLVVDTAAAALAEQRPKPVSSRPLLTSPNPTRGPATITYSLPAPGRIRLAIYDAAGRLVRVVADRTVSAGAHQQLWDGRNAVGRPVGAGIYVARLSGAAETRSTRLVLVR